MLDDFELTSSFASFASPILRPDHSTSIALTDEMSFMLSV